MINGMYHHRHLTYNETIKITASYTTILHFLNTELPSFDKDQTPPGLLFTKKYAVNRNCKFNIQHASL